MIAVALKSLMAALALASIFMLAFVFHTIRSRGDVAKARLFLRFDILHNIHIYGVAAVMAAICANIILLLTLSHLVSREILIPYTMGTIFFNLACTAVSASVCRLLRSL